MVGAMFNVEAYKTLDGKSPFEEWHSGLDALARARIDARLERVAAGNFGDWGPIEGAVRELRFHFGSGYRVYFGVDGETVVLLLCGGDKSTQRRDIAKAKAHWQDYLSRREGK
jgi:putative addiction module killer protein